jgi:uncharacterized protein (AIM24 family)
MMFVSGDVSLELELTGGLKSGLKRAVLAGESLAFTRYRAKGAAAVGLAGRYPGSIRKHELDGEIICDRRAYLAHTGEVSVESAFAKKLGIGWLGEGEGFVLERLTGKGAVWLHGGGDSVDFDLVRGSVSSSILGAW